MFVTITFIIYYNYFLYLLVIISVIIIIILNHHYDFSLTILSITSFCYHLFVILFMITIITIAFSHNSLFRDITKLYKHRDCWMYYIFSAFSMEKEHFQELVWTNDFSAFSMANPPLIIIFHGERPSSQAVPQSGHVIDCPSLEAAFTSKTWLNVDPKNALNVGVNHHLGVSENSVLQLPNG